MKKLSSNGAKVAGLSSANGTWTSTEQPAISDDTWKGSNSENSVSVFMSVGTKPPSGARLLAGVVLGYLVGEELVSATKIPQGLPVFLGIVIAIFLSAGVVVVKFPRGSYGRETYKYWVGQLGSWLAGIPIGYLLPLLKSFVYSADFWTYVLPTPLLVLSVYLMVEAQRGFELPRSRVGETYPTDEWRWWLWRRRMVRAFKKYLRVLEISALVLSTFFAAWSAVSSYQSLVLSQQCTVPVRLGPSTYLPHMAGIEIGVISPLQPCRTEVTSVRGQIASNCQAMLQSVGVGSLTAQVEIGGVVNGTSRLRGDGCWVSNPDTGFINFDDIISTRPGSILRVSVMCLLNNCNVTAAFSATVFEYK